MDQEQFDRITRTLASGLSRRGVLRTLSAVGAGGVLAVVGRGTAEAGKCRPPKERCSKGKNAPCCSSSEYCAGTTCAPRTRTVTVRLTAADDFGEDCYVRVEVTGFAPYKYEGVINGFPTTVIVGADGTGTGYPDNDPNRAFTSGSHTVVATVDGLSSDPSVTVSCDPT